jgi:hypothetical protein
VVVGWQGLEAWQGVGGERRCSFIVGLRRFVAKSSLTVASSAWIECSVRVGKDEDSSVGSLFAGSGRRGMVNVVAVKSSLWTAQLERFLGLKRKGSVARSEGGGSYNGVWSRKI